MRRPGASWDPGHWLTRAGELKEAAAHAVGLGEPVLEGSS